MVPLVVLGATEFSAEIADVVGDGGTYEIAAFVENDVPERAGRSLHGIPVLWIDEARELAATHLAVCGLGTTRRSRFTEGARLSDRHPRRRNDRRTWSGRRRAHEDRAPRDRQPRHARGTPHGDR